MKNLLLAASAALFSFAAVAQTVPTTVAGKTPADGRAYGQAVSTAVQAKNEKQAKPFTDAEKDASKAREEARKDADKDQQEARKDADKSAKMADARADKMEKHERSARGEHAHGGDHMGHAKEHKEHKEHKMK